MIKTLYFFENSDDQYTMTTLDGAKELIKQLDCWEDAVVSVYEKKWCAGSYYWDTVNVYECATPIIYEEIEEVKSTIRDLENEIKAVYKDIDDGVTTLEDEEMFLKGAQEDLEKYAETLRELKNLAIEL